MSGVMIGTVAVGPPEWGFVKSLVGLIAPGEKTFHLVRGKQGIDEGHNRLCADFLESGDEWLLSMDSDAVLHPMTLIRLLSWDEPFVTALAVGRVAPFAAVVYGEGNDEGLYKRETGAIRDWVRAHPQLLQLSGATVLQPRPEDALFPIYRSGAHCLLTHRDVIEAIEPPWFERTGNNAHLGRGSDFYFTEKARAAGFETVMDRSVVAGHVVHGHVATLLDMMVWDNVINYETGTIEVPIGRTNGTDDQG